MALKDVTEILTRLATDSDFRAKFFDAKTKDKVLELYSSRLTKEEFQCLRELTEESVEEFASKKVEFCSDIRI